MASLSEMSIVTKEQRITQDVECNLFVTTENIPIEKRKGKCKNPKSELVNLDVYAKKTDFLTDRPLVWAQAIDKYVADSPDTSCRWDYIKENNLYCKCKILLYYEQTSKVEILLSHLLR